MTSKIQLVNQYPKQLNLYSEILFTSLQIYKVNIFKNSENKCCECMQTGVDNYTNTHLQTES